MVTLLIPPSFAPAQVEVPDGVERSCKGALHLRPGTKRVTPAEWEHLKAKAPELAKRLRVSEVAKKAEPEKAAAEKKPEPEKDSEDKKAPKKKAADK